MNPGRDDGPNYLGTGGGVSRRPPENDLPSWTPVDVDRTVPAPAPTGRGPFDANGAAAPSGATGARDAGSVQGHYPDEPRPTGRPNPLAIVSSLVVFGLLVAGAYLWLSRSADDDLPEAAVTDDGLGSEVASANNSGDAGDAGNGEDAATGTEAERDMRTLLANLGYDDIGVEDRDGVLYLTGSVETAEELSSLIIAAATGIQSSGINAAGLTVSSRLIVPTDGEDGAVAIDPTQRLQVRLDRASRARPVLFAATNTAVESWHEPTLDQVAELLAGTDQTVSIIGYTDESGDSAANTTLSLDRAIAVRDYLLGKGLAADLLDVEARGESNASGLRDIGYLERRVEFEVAAAADLPDPPARQLQVGVIVPSAQDDLAFSQALIDALGVLQEERGGLDLTVTENMFVVDDGLEQARTYIADGADVVILHGSQFMPILEELAGENPDVVFIGGPDEFESDLENVFFYTVAAEQGAYVMGDLAGQLTITGRAGIVGPVPAAEPARYVQGFHLGFDNSGGSAEEEYVGSFNDIEAATALAEDYIERGADVLTGTAQLTPGPIEVARTTNALWFGNQTNQTELAPDVVVSSQVYHFEVALREILAEIDIDSTTGGAFPLTLGNGGLLIEFNPDYPLSSSLRQRADELLFDVTAGSVSIDIELPEE